jgi:hypothetical protein
MVGRVSERCCLAQRVRYFTYIDDARSNTNQVYIFTLSIYISSKVAKDHCFEAYKPKFLVHFSCSQYGKKLNPFHFPRSDHRNNR